MGLNDGPYGGGYHNGGGFGGPPTHPGGFGGPPIHPKAAEAHLLSQATATAMIAARSILMSGGSEEVALKTAKAAAQSVLNPSTPSDAETISGRSTTFLRRRKAKRQAEVVASMALMSAASNVRGGVGNDWDTFTASTENRSVMNPYARNITTRSMQDDPSVLSGSTRLLQTNTPPLSLAGSQRSAARSIEQNYAAMEETKAAPPPPPPPRPAEFQHNNSAAKYSPPLSTGSQAQRASPTPSVEVTKKDESAKKSKFLDRIRSRRKDLAETLPLEDPIYANSNSNLSDVSNGFDGHDEDGSDNDDGTENDYDESTIGGDTQDDRGPSSTSKNSVIWQHLDPLLVSFTNTFNSLTCGIPIPTSDADPDQKARNQKDKGREEVDIGDDSFDEEDIFSGDETDPEERQDRGDGRRDMDNSFDHGPLKEQFSSSSSCSNSSLDSSQLFRDLHSESLSEGEIQIRSSIRESMEKVVSKSKPKGVEETIDRTWLTYESRQDDGPEVLHSPSRKTTARAQTAVNPKSKKKSLFSRGKNR